MLNLEKIKDVAFWIFIIALVLILAKYVLFSFAFVFGFAKIFILPSFIVWLIAKLLTLKSP